VVIIKNTKTLSIPKRLVKYAIILLLEKVMRFIALLNASKNGGE